MPSKYRFYKLPNLNLINEAFSSGSTYNYKVNLPFPISYNGVLYQNNIDIEVEGGEYSTNLPLTPYFDIPFSINAIIGNVKVNILSYEGEQNATPRMKGYMRNMEFAYPPYDGIGSFFQNLPLINDLTSIPTNKKRVYKALRTAYTTNLNQYLDYIGSTIECPHTIIKSNGEVINNKYISFCPSNTYLYDGKFYLGSFTSPPNIRFSETLSSYIIDSSPDFYYTKANDVIIFEDNYPTIFDLFDSSSFSIMKFAINVGEGTTYISDSKINKAVVGSNNYLILYSNDKEVFRQLFLNVKSITINNIIIGIAEGEYLLYPVIENNSNYIEYVNISVSNKTVFRITAYNNTSPYNKINKYIIPVLDMFGTLKENTDVVNPSVTIYYEEVPSFNYIYIEEFKRYYYIKNIISLKNNLWLIDMKCDVLMSHKETIKNQKLFVGRSQYDYDEYLPDDKLVLTPQPNIYILKSSINSPFGSERNTDNQFVNDTTPCYIVGVYEGD